MFGVMVLLKLTYNTQTNAKENYLKFGADSCINKYLSPWKFIVWTELQRKKNVISVK